MNGIIITNSNYGESSQSIAHKVNRLQKEFNKVGIYLDLLINDGTLFSVTNGKISLSFKVPDFVIYLDKDRYLANAINKLNIPIFPKPSFLSLCDDKELTHVFLSELGINMPKTIATPLTFYTNKEFTALDNKFLDNIEKEMSFPMIVKDVYGSLGQNMNLLKNKEELYHIYQEKKGRSLIFQEYFVSSFGKSIRVLVIDNEIVGAIERYNEVDFRSNFNSSGARAIKVNKKIEDIVKKISSKFDLEYVGIDLLYGPNDELFLVEMNSNAFFKHFESCTKINVGKKFVDMVLRRITK